MSPQKIWVEALTLVPQIVTLFENTVFVEVMKFKIEALRVGPNPT